MIHVRMTSGERLAAIAVEEVANVALKTRLQDFCDCTRFRQRLLSDCGALEDQRFAVTRG